MERVEQVDDVRIADYRSLRERELRTVPAGAGRFVAEGTLVVERLLASRYRVRSVFVREDRLPVLGALLAAVPDGTPVYCAPSEVFARTGGVNFHQGLLAMGEEGQAARAARAGVASGRSGAVVVAQRFGSALNLNLHFHALVLDGVYASPDSFTRPRFHPGEPLSDRDVEEVTALLHRRILRHLTRAGPLRRSADELEPEPEEPLLAEIYAASVQGRGVLAVPCQCCPLLAKGLPARQRVVVQLRPLSRRQDPRAVESSVVVWIVEHDNDAGLGEVGLPPRRSKEMELPSSRDVLSSVDRVHVRQLRRRGLG